jgi:Protein of unknown function (DUF2911)
LNVPKTIAIAALVLASGLTAGTVHADEADQAIQVTFSRPVQIPGQVLPAGTYWFTLVNERMPQMVQILSNDKSRSYGIANTIARERPVANANAAFTLAKRGAGEPEAVVAWFYPGHSVGHEFVYSRQVEMELSKAEQHTQVSGN